MYPKNEGQITVDNITYTIFDVNPDGNCMFHALCQHPYFANRGYNQRRLRNELEPKVKDLYDKHYRVKTAVHGNYDKPYDGTIGRAMDIIRGGWCGQFECAFIALMFPVRISIITPTIGTPGQYTNIYNSDYCIQNYKIAHLKENHEEPHDITLMFFRMARHWSLGTPLYSYDPPDHFMWLRNDNNINVYDGREEKLRKKKLHNAKNAIEIDQDEVVEENSNKDIELPGKLKSDDSVAASEEKVIHESPLIEKYTVEIDQDEVVGENSLPGNLKSVDSNSEVPVNPTSTSTPKKQNLNLGQWYELTNLFHTEKQKYKSQKAFLQSNESNPLTFKDRSSFSRNYKAYKDGSLALKLNPFQKRNRKSPFFEIESTLLQQLHTEKLRLSHKEVRHKAIQIWKDSNTECERHFSASKGWLHRLLKRSMIQLRRKERK